MLGAVLSVATGYAAAAPVASPLARGERAFQKCYSCHSSEPGRSDLTGPTLHNIIGRRIASEHGFDYSPALKRFARSQPRWTRKLVSRFSADPEELVPGTSMTFHGIADANERAALIRYLESLGHRPSSGKSKPRPSSD